MWQAVEQQIFSDFKTLFRLQFLETIGPITKSENSKLLVKCFWTCWRKAICLLGTFFQICSPLSPVLSPAQLGCVSMCIWPFLSEIHYFCCHF